MILALLQNTRRLCGVLRRTFSDSILQEGARRATRRAEPSRAKPSRADLKKKKTTLASQTRLLRVSVERW